MAGVVGVSVVVVVEVGEELGSLAVVAAALGETLRILRGREGILAGGDVIGGGTVVNSEVVVVGVLNGRDSD
jgi:hypothetical protein